MYSLNSLISFVDKLITIIIIPVVVLLSVAIAGLLAWGIFSRSVLAMPVFGLEELVLMSAMWLYMLGAVLAAKDRSHLTADFVSVVMKNEKWKAFIAVVATAISLVMASYFTTWSYSLFEWAVNKAQITPVLKLPWYISQSSLFIGSIALVFYLIRDLIQDTKKFIEI